MHMISCMNVFRSTWVGTSTCYVPIKQKPCVCRGEGVLKAWLWVWDHCLRHSASSACKQGTAPGQVTARVVCRLQGWDAERHSKWRGFSKWAARETSIERNAVKKRERKERKGNFTERSLGNVKSLQEKLLLLKDNCNWWLKKMNRCLAASPHAWREEDGWKTKGQSTGSPQVSNQIY